MILCIFAHRRAGQGDFFWGGVSDTDTSFREMGSLADKSESLESRDLGNVGRSCSLANCDS